MFAVSVWERAWVQGVGGSAYPSFITARLLMDVERPLRRRAPTLKERGESVLPQNMETSFRHSRKMRTLH